MWETYPMDYITSKKSSIYHRNRVWFNYIHNILSSWYASTFLFRKRSKRKRYPEVKFIPIVEHSESGIHRHNPNSQIHSGMINLACLSL